MKKRVVTLLCTAVLTLGLAAAPAMASDVPLRPIEVESYTYGPLDELRISKVYRLSVADDPSGIPTEDFVSGGRRYYLLDMTADTDGEVVTYTVVFGSVDVAKDEKYCPAMNIHRTPFSGRNNEYYSEDPFMSGNVAAASMKAAAEKGMYTYIKHFALNDQENHRGDTTTEWGAATFANEQSIRQIYLMPFEMCMKSGTVTLNYVQDGQLTSTQIRACQALMTSFNRLGYTWTGGHYNLITGILRNEWDFKGFVITDADTPTHMDPVQMIKAGADGKLNYSGSYDLDTSDPAIYHYARDAAHHILYTIANSKIMNGAMPGSTLTGMSTATMLRIVLSVVSVLIIALLTFFNVRRWRKKV